MASGIRKTLGIALPAAAIAAILSMALIEAWVRLRWDDRRGTPGFYVSDPLLGQRLSPGYRGWFAGVPVEINSLGFRDSRDYALETLKSDYFELAVKRLKAESAVAAGVDSEGGTCD